MTTDKHVDPAAAVPVGDEEEDGNLQDVPEGAVRFELDRADIEEALAAPSMQVTNALACACVCLQGPFQHTSLWASFSLHSGALLCSLCW